MGNQRKLEGQHLLIMVAVVGIGISMYFEISATREEIQQLKSVPLLQSIQCKDGRVVYKTSDDSDFIYTPIHCTGESDE